MDRTLIAPWKAEERELSEKLYKKLFGLTLLHPPTEEFRKCFNDEMFLKPNPVAFFQVMHYLFKLHDPFEFRKRFYWPINDKRAEASFRASTIEYLKYLDERHQLHWSNIRSYLVQIPGGMKFINFMLNLVGFIVQEQIKQREKYLCSDLEAGQISDVHLKRMRKQNAFLKEYASAYIREADALIGKLKDKTLLVRRQIEEIAKAAGLDFEMITSDAFTQKFQECNRELFVQKCSKPATKICALEQSMVNLKEAIEKFQNKKTELQIDEDAVRHSLMRIQQMFPEQFPVDEEFQSSPYFDGTIKMNTLIVAFNIIYASIEQKLEAANKRPQLSRFVRDELSLLKTELDRVEVQITDFQKKLNTHSKKRTNMTNTPLRPYESMRLDEQEAIGNNLLAKFVATPPIKLDAIEGNQHMTTRLPFLDDFTLNIERPIVANAKADIDSLNNLLALPRSARKFRDADMNTTDLNNTMNKSKIIDPIQLLRTISKDTPKSKIFTQQQQDKSTLNIKWKERQSVFGKDIDATSNVLENAENRTMIRTIGESYTQQLSNDIIPIVVAHTPFTPLKTNDHTRVARSQLEHHDIGSSVGNVLPKKLSAVKKVQDASLNFHNLSTSPSGRLEPLVAVEVKDVPKLLLNDLSLNECKAVSLYSLNVDETKAAFNTTIKRSTMSARENDENDGNLVNSNQDFVFNLGGRVDGNDLFNVSDSVLKDVLM